MKVSPVWPILRPKPEFATGPVQAGGLISYSPDFTWIARRHAHLVNSVLRGTPPADVPVEQPTKYDLVINLKTAQALGLTIPPSLLAQADEVIE